jgi:hypothetical protein
MSSSPHSVRGSKRKDPSTAIGNLPARAVSASCGSFSAYQLESALVLSLPWPAKLRRRVTISSSENNLKDAHGIKVIALPNGVSFLKATVTGPFECGSFWAAWRLRPRGGARRRRGGHSILSENAQVSPPGQSDSSHWSTETAGHPSGSISHAMHRLLPQYRQRPLPVFIDAGRKNWGHIDRPSPWHSELPR